MKIAIDSGPLQSGHKVRGVGVYTRELIGALEQENRLRKATAHLAKARHTGTAQPDGTLKQNGPDNGDNRKGVGCQKNYL